VTNLSCVDDEGGSSLRFSLDGKFLVAAGGGKFTEVWETGSWRAVTHLSGASAGSVAFSRDSRLLATHGSSSTVRLWEVGTWKLLESLSGHNKDVTSLIFTPDGHSLVTGSDDSTVRIWNVSSGQTQATVRHAGSVKASGHLRTGKRLPQAI
jgi:WD40 repeat protein